ncbi:Uncharacterized protein Adt_13850 [Abeliophyllum distichum]|uniref:Transposase (putative) gypsy type domain-containing protein n=1 Tax=Abeliophyllum distichum TaxID=126358 RepID=A0ABD1TXY8_9LAMI
MSSDHEDSQNRSDPGTDPGIMDEASSSSSSVGGQENIPTSTSERGDHPAILPKTKVGGGKTGSAVLEMRSSLDQRNAPAAYRLDEELKHSATEAYMVRSKIREEYLVDIRLSYNISNSVTLRAPSPEERANDPHEGFVSIYEPAIQQGLRLPIHPFFHEVLQDWNLAPCQITPNGWGQITATYLLWKVVEVGGDIFLKDFKSIYRPCRSAGWYNISPRPGQKWETATDSPNKVNNWKDRFFFTGGGWEFFPEDPRPDVSIPRQFGDLDCRKLPIPRKNQEGLRMKWEKVGALDNDSRSLNNLLKDDDLLIRFGLMGGFKEVPSFQARMDSQGEPSSQGVLDSTLLRTVIPPLSVAPSPIQTAPSLPLPPPSPPSPSPSSRSVPQKDKENEIANEAVEGTGYKRKASGPVEGIMRDARRNRRRRDVSLYLGPIPASPAIIAASVYKYWTRPWKRTAEEASTRDLLRLTKMNLVHGLVLTKEVFSTLGGFNVKLAKEEANSKKLSEELKAMSLEKAQLESKKKFLQVRLDTLANKGNELKAKHEVQLAASNECFKDARTRKRATEVAQKSIEEAQKLVEDRAFAAETALATANSVLEALAIEKERLLAEAREEMERLNADRAEAEAKAVAAYQEGSGDTPEYQDLAHHFMTTGREQLVKRISEVHPKWDLSFLRHPPGEASTFAEPSIFGEFPAVRRGSRYSPS